MAVKMPLKWALMGLLVGTAIVPVNSDEPLTNCDWLTVSTSGCVKYIDCQPTGIGLRVWEDCPSDGELFTITDAAIELKPDCRYGYGDRTIFLKEEIDAEGSDASKSCEFSGLTNKLFFEAIDINEDSPYPSGDTLSVMEVDIMENISPPHEIAKIHYSDDDDGETKTLKGVLISSEYEDLFTLEEVSVDEMNKWKTFSFNTAKALDFEGGAFYKVEYEIISTDDKRNQLNATHTFLVSVGDASDNSPFWIDIVPFYVLDECQEKKDLFHVTAQDRDVMVNNAIKYSFVEEQEYFDIDKDTGVVKRKLEIDREELLEDGISSFSLAIQATEYDRTSGEIVEEPNSIKQVSTITIQDCNDEAPLFDDDEYTIEIDEVTESSGSIILDLSIVVKDMDAGDNGTFTLKTNRPDEVDISPVEGKQTQTVTLTALYRPEKSIFDYEDQKNTPFTIQITATEKVNTSHTSTTLVNITLCDVNDEEPFFLENPYSKGVDEGSDKDTYILTVEANDYDVSPEFGKTSIRYSLESSCNEFQIDPESGDVTLFSVLDFEDKAYSNDNLIECKVTARDRYGTGAVNTATTTIAISIIDVVDESPQFVSLLGPMNISENSNPGTMVGNIIVTDEDAEASISFEIQEADCTDGTSTTDVTGWFTVNRSTPEPPNYPATLKVGTVKIDREACKEVTLIILANDDNTDEKYEYKSSDTESFIITIVDENDALPIVECESGCDDISVDEVNEIDGNDDSVFVFRVTVTDPDEKDTISLSLSEGGDKMFLSKESVTVEAGSVEVVEVWTKKGATIDRETQGTIDIEISFTDSENHSDTKKVSVKVNDLNDKRPVINAALCNGNPIEVEEDDGSGEKNGISIGMILATDDDKESPHNHVTYMMLNDKSPSSKDTWTPFTIDEETGNVTILLIDGEKALDREQFANWELLFRAVDDCNEELKCAVLTSQPDCIVNITVKDVNDHDPRDLKRLPDEPVKVTDFLKKDEELGYLFFASDDDEGDNAKLTYSVSGTYRPNSNINMNLFRAEDELYPTDPSCRLYANEDFENKNYTGEFNVILKAEDGGNRWTEFNISVYVEDANDEVPYFVLGGCLGEPEDNIIRMEENAYTPGENNQPAKMEVRCSKPDGPAFTINVEDKDTDSINKRVTVQIDKENSTVEHLGDNVDEQTLLSYWSLEPEDCENGCRLKISHQIDREQGTAYNLSLYVRNTALPTKESWAFVRVVVTNKMEYNPYFCATDHCSQVVYMYENDPDVSADFYKATDNDNNGVSPGDEQYNAIYYYIVDGDKDYFKTIDDTQETIVLKTSEGLDREKKDEYFLKILATNTPWEQDIGDLPRNDTLNLIIRVGDVNDEDPVFRDDVIFTSFMESWKKDDHLCTIEAIDLDLNETLTYEMQDDLQWFETDFLPEDPFRIERKDNRSAYLTINFDPKGITRGYCNFTISVEDLEGHRSEAEVKVYVINEEYLVDMYFSNEVEEIQSKEDQIEEIYSSIYNYKCNIDSIAPTEDSSGQIVANKTTVYMHFIDEEKNEPVDVKKILDLSDSVNVMTPLLSRLSLIGIYLDSVDTYLEPSYTNSQDTIRKLQILLGVVSLVMGLLVLLLASVYWLRTNKLQRKIKVLSTNTFGSKEEGLNQMGLDMGSVPGSNYLAKEHGNHNPVFSESGGLEFNNRDTESISSGDSVLVGVEDNPEFKSYSAKGTPASTSRGFENLSYGWSIDNVTAAPPGVQGGMKGNPLLNLGVLKDDTEQPDP